MPNNKYAVFITNTPSEARGSSIYIIMPSGTIRFSGANDKERTATTFIRPYTLAIFHIISKE